jgi:TRAP-type C4-dicarboxylate transport system substrate-binding protein
MMRLTNVLGLCALAVAATVAAPTTAAAETVELRIASLAPAGSPWMSVLDKASAEIKEKTNGKVTLKYFEGGQQGDERDFVRKIKLGQLDGAAVTAVGLSMIDESIRVLELPMMFESVEELDYVADKMWPYFQQKFEKKGFTLNDRGDVGWVYFFSKGKVSSINDLKGQKIWMWGDDQIVGAMYKKLGLGGVPLGVPEVDSALTAGRIDAAYGSALSTVALQWYTKIKFMTSMPMSYAIAATVLSNDAIKKIPAGEVETLKKISKAASKKLRKTIRKANDDAKKTMARKGVSVVQSPPEMVDEFTKHAQEVWKQLVGKVYTQQELDMVLKYRDEFRAKNKK